MRTISIATLGYSRFLLHDYIPFLEVEKYFKEGDSVQVTERIRSNQVSIGRTYSGNLSVTSKHLAAQGLTLNEYHDETVLASLARWWFRRPKQRNFFWEAAQNTNVLSILNHWPISTQIQVWGMVVPSLSPGFPYADKAAKPSLLIERVAINGVDQGYNTFFSRWTPLLYCDKFDPEKVLALTCGSEMVSGKKLHPRVGILIRHTKLQTLPDGRPLIAVADPRTFEEWSQRQ